MVLPLIIAGLAIGLVEAVSNERSNNSQAEFNPKNSCTSSSCHADDLIDLSAFQIHVDDEYYQDLLDSFEIIRDCGAWEEFTSHPITFTSDDSTKSCQPSKKGRTPCAHTNYERGVRINLCNCSWGLTPIDRAFVLLHEWNHIDLRQQGAEYGGVAEEKECDLYALEILNQGGYSPQEVVSRFVQPGDRLPGFQEQEQESSVGNLNVHVNPKYREHLMEAFGIIEDCGAWGDFTKYPIVFTSDDSSPYCQPGVGAHTDGENMNFCSCCWDLHASDLAFVMLHEWHHIHCRQRGLAYTGDPEERDCDMYALGVLHRGGLTTKEFATKFVRPGD